MSVRATSPSVATSVAAPFHELGNRVLEMRLGLLEDPLDAGMIRVDAKLGGELLSQREMEGP